MIIYGDIMLKEYTIRPEYDENENHLSRLAHCGKRYAYERMRGTVSSHKDIFDVGLAWEAYVFQLAKQKYGNAISNYVIDINIGGTTFTGHIDIFVPPECNNGTAIAFEVKYSETSNDYYDLYVRQLRAYGAALQQHGITAELWLEMYKRKTWREYQLHNANQDDFKLLETQYAAYSAKQYMTGIESSICKLCPLLQHCNAQSLERYGVPVWLNW